MRVLVIGSGGREGAIVSALARSASVGSIVAAPGNPGIAAVADVRQVDAADPRAVTELARRVGADLVVVGPEAPLVAGVADVLQTAGRMVFGPQAAAARIEGSKAYAKELMERAGIATARWRRFEDPGAASAWLDEVGPPYVVKADGLAAGKGVTVTLDRAEAVAAIEERLVSGRFGAAGRTVVIEEFLDGEELSLIVFTDGKSVVPCAPAQDYKRLRDGDRGPNTGGMGSYSPVPACDEALAAQVVDEIIIPMVDATAGAGAPFAGALYAGLALTGSGPKVVEFNARFGDPETQALLPRLRSDFGELCAAAASGDLAGMAATWDPRACVAVVLASQGYPDESRRGDEIAGVADAAAVPGVEIFHAGTALDGDRLVTAGGRVLAVSALGESHREARETAYRAAGLIDFEGKQIRGDIALRATREVEIK